MRVFLDLYTLFFTLQSIWIAAAFGIVLWQVCTEDVHFYQVLCITGMVLCNISFAYVYMPTAECIFSCYVYNMRCEMLWG